VRPRQLATYVAYRYLGEAMARVPEPVAWAAAQVVGAVLARRDALPRQMAERHIRHVLAWDSPAVEPDDELVARWARRCFAEYARYWMEGARLPGVPTADVLARMLIVEGYEHLRDAMAAGRGVVMALPHVGSWEWGGAYLAADGYPMLSVAELIDPPQLFSYFIEQRRAIGLDIVPLDGDSGGAVLNALRAGRLVGLLCDRDIMGTGVAVTFFGETTTFAAGPATVALRTGATLVAATVYSGPGPFHLGVISPPLDTSRTGRMRVDVARVTQDLAATFEGFIARNPEQWHVFQPEWPSDLDGGAGPAG